MFSTVNVYYNSSNVLTKMTVNGHAGIKEIGLGYEACIALSSLSQGMYKALIKTLGKACLSYKRKSGSLLIEFNIEKINKLSIDNIQFYKNVTKGYLIAIKELSIECPSFIKYIEEF